MLPTFKDIAWRWLAYFGSAAVLGAIVFACVHELELKQDVPCDIVSSSEVKLRGYEGSIAAVFVQPGERVVRGTPLFKLASDAILADGTLRVDAPADADKTIVAPRAGVVVASGLLPGRRLDPAEVAVVIDTDPERPLTAVLRVPPRQRAFVSAGQTIRIKFDAIPYPRVGSYVARIAAVSATVQGRHDESGRVAGTPREAGEYLAWAILPDKRLPYAGQTLQILPGMQGHASIVVERRTIAEWMLAPLFRMSRG